MIFWKNISKITQNTYKSLVKLTLRKECLLEQQQMSHKSQQLYSHANQIEEKMAYNNLYHNLSAFLWRQNQVLMNYEQTLFKIKMGKKKPTSVPKKSQAQIQKTSQAKINKQKEKGRLLAKIYRQYSRRKYNKYRLQYPKLRESDIINKIIKEWEALTQDDKLNLEKQFLETGGPDFLKDDSKSKSKSKSSSSKSKPKQGQGQAKKQEGAEESRPKKKKKPSPKVRIFVEKATDKNRDYREDSDFKKDEGEKKKGKASPSGSSESVELVVKGKKKIGKAKEVKKVQQKEKKATTEYLSFFKYYYNRLSSQHPRWKPKEVTMIVKLLWKKRNAKATSKTKAIRKRNLMVKPVSGRVMYRKQKQASGYSLGQIKALWKNLPYESKKYWQLKGRGGRRAMAKSPNESIGQLKKVLKSGSETNIRQRNTFKWMDSLIKLS